MLSVVYDDAIAVYLNGTEVLRRNLATNASYEEVALNSGSSLENLWQSFSIANGLRAGTNTLAVEVHRRSLGEADLSFDSQLRVSEAEGTLQFAGPPRRVSSAVWALDFSGPVGATVVVEGSAGFNAWSPLGNVLLTNGAGSFTNMPTSEAGSSFFRLRR